MSRLRWVLTSTCACLALFRLSTRWKERRSRGKVRVLAAMKLAIWELMGVFFFFFFAIFRCLFFLIFST